MAVRVSELRNGAAKAGNGHARGVLGSSRDLDDRMLVLDFQAGNDEAFTEIHRRYYGLARHVCQRILHNPEDTALRARIREDVRELTSHFPISGLRQARPGGRAGRGSESGR